MSSNPELEAIIEAAPDDVAGYLVYGDWLQAQGDPRGELIALQAANKATPAQELIDGHRAHFFGRMAELGDMLQPFAYDPLGATTSWRWGFLDKLWISSKHARKANFGPMMPLVDALGWMLEHPSTRFLRELTVGIVDYKDNSYDAVAQVIGRRRMPTLVKLILGDFYYEETELNWSNLGDVSPIYAAVPNLESLTLRSGTITVGAIDLPKLRELAVISGGLDRESFDAIVSAPWPNLERLNLQLGNELAFEIADLAPILDGTTFPKLRHLGLGNTTRGDEVCAAIAASRIASRLQSIDMSLSTMGDAGAAALAAGSFPRLAQLDITKCFVSEAGIAALAKVGALIGEADQEDDEGDPENRYISGRE